MESNYTATNQSERIALIDILRGFAIFGILMVNLPFMYNGTSTAMLDVIYGDISTFQMVCESFICFFFEGKFYIIFSLLFGYGFWLFMKWLKKFYFGPFEWLWRCLTYGTIQPLLRK